MKELYFVNVFGESESHFEERYSKEEIKIIEKFFNDMSRHDVPHYDIPLIEFEKDGKIIIIPNFGDEK